jgi:predicted RNA-binding Zn-ribbon protein involved in translation (DUF1610 family)
MKPIVDPEVECFERVRAAYSIGFGISKIALLCVVLVAGIVGIRYSHDWLMLTGIALVGLLVILPQVIRIDRLLRSLPCPNCGMEVGGYRTAFSRVFLRCKRCGHVAPTDCLFPYPGGPPGKA